MTKNTFNADAAMQKVKAAIGLYAQTAALKLEREAKSNAPWQDRTTNARNSIQGNSGWEGSQAIIRLSGNMSYSVYLELAHGKRYAVLIPTIRKNAASVIKGYEKVVR